MVLCVVLAVGPLPLPIRPPRIHLTSFTWWMLPGLPHFNFCQSSNSVYYCERNRRSKWGRPGTEASCSVVVVMFLSVLSNCSWYSWGLFWPLQQKSVKSLEYWVGHCWSRQGCNEIHGSLGVGYNSCRVRPKNALQPHKLFPPDFSPHMDH